MKRVKLPRNVLNWNVIALSKGDRTDTGGRTDYEEEVYSEITANVDTLVLKLGLK